MLFLLLACQAPDKSPDSVDDSSVTDTTGTTGGKTTGTTNPTGTTGTGTVTSDFTGVPPENPVPLPDFTATNDDGGPRNRDDLLGHRTIIWFYPAASTAG